jgi:hypothetical protein
MPQPPLLPEEILARVTRLARCDGLSVLVLGTVFALATAATRNLPFAAVGLLAAGAGAVELHGVALLRTGESRGMSWIIASQPFLLCVIFGYCALRLALFAIPPLPDGLKELTATRAQELGMSMEELFRFTNRLAVGALSAASLCYQGGMTIYYARRRKAVAQALAATSASE